MKYTKYLLPLACLLLSSPLRAQTKYCIVELTSQGGEAVTITIHTGSDKKLYQLIKNEDSSFLRKSFQYPVDVMNWMGAHNWELVNIQQSRGFLVPSNIMTFPQDF